jgi:hypothetical protein
VTRPISFAHSVEEVEARKTEALAIVGKRILEVRYVTIDYNRYDLARDHVGFREVSDEAEWATKAWSFPHCDSVDFGVEIETADGSLFSIAWDPPGDYEGIGLYPLPMSQLLRPDADVAVWSVGGSSRWVSKLGATITNAELSYAQWSQISGDYWCTSVILHVGISPITLTLGEASDDGSIAPSSDNVAIVF